MINNKTPKQGLKVLEKLYQQNPQHQGILYTLIHAYIKFGYHDKAISLITNSLANSDALFDAWLAHKNSNIDKERQIWDKLINDNQAYFLQTHSQIKHFISKTHGQLQFIN